MTDVNTDGSVGALEESEPGNPIHPDQQVQDMLEALSYEYTSIETFESAVYEVNQYNGWFDAERTFGEEVALIHSEVSEALEAYRTSGNVRDYTPEHPDPASNNPYPKPDGVGSELADVFIRLLDTCRRHNIDLEFETKRKLTFNAYRGYRHGDKSL